MNAQIQENVLGIRSHSQYLKTTFEDYYSTAGNPSANYTILPHLSFINMNGPTITRHEESKEPRAINRTNPEGGEMVQARENK